MRGRGFSYTADWQLHEEVIDDDADSDTDRRAQYVWGPRYIDDAVLRREDRDDDGYYDECIRYYLTDVQFSVMATIDETAAIVERVNYTPYGIARHHRLADLDGDGDTDGDDETILTGNYGDIYDMPNWVFGLGDLDRDGDVDSTDWAIWNADDGGTTLDDGELSLPFDDAGSEDNVIGFDGYVFNAETQHYKVRWRDYEPPLGRWVERDPAGFIDGSNLYQFVSSQPTLANDPRGLCQAAPGAPCPLPAVSPAKIPVVWPDGYAPYPDPLNVTPSPQEASCCSRFRHSSGHAQVICCGQKKIICVWNPSGLRSPVPRRRIQDEAWRKGYDRGTNLADECIVRHERRHVTQPRYSCDGRPDGPMPDPAKGTPDHVLNRCEHCQILRAHLGCVNRALKSCKTAGCRYVLEREQGRVRRIKRDTCRGVGGSQDPL